MRRALYAAMATNMDSSVFFRFTASARPRIVQASVRSVSLVTPVGLLRGGDARLPTQPKHSAQGRLTVRPDAWLNR